VESWFKRRSPFPSLRLERFVLPSNSMGKLKWARWRYKGETIRAREMRVRRRLVPGKILPTGLEKCRQGKESDPSWVFCAHLVPYLGTLRNSYNLRSVVISQPFDGLNGSKYRQPPTTSKVVILAQNWHHWRSAKYTSCAGSYNRPKENTVWLLQCRVCNSSWEEQMAGW
jgi:hypothetical protein